MRRALALAAALAAATLLPQGAAAQARVSSVSRQIEVSGEVQKTLSLDLEAVRAIAARRGRAEVKGYAGILLVELLNEADIRQDQPRALRRTFVVAKASDGYQAVFSWGELYNSPLGRGVLVAFERDGKPLQDGEGQFALVSLADDKPGPRHVKWLRSVDVRRVPE